MLSKPNISEQMPAAPERCPVADVHVVPAPLSPALASFAELWQSKRRGDRLPGRADFDMDDLGPWLGSILMMDVIDGARDFRYRLIGTVLVENLGRDRTGRRVSECDYEGYRDDVLGWFRQPVLMRAPVFRRGRMVWMAEMSWRRYESVHCPLAADGETVDMTIGVQVYLNPRMVERPSP